MHITSPQTSSAVTCALIGGISGFMGLVTSCALGSISPLLYCSLPMELLFLGSLYLLKDKELNNNLSPLINALALAILFSGASLVTHFRLEAEDQGWTYLLMASSLLISASPLYLMLKEKDKSLK